MGLWNGTGGVDLSFLGGVVEAFEGSADYAGPVGLALGCSGWGSWLRCPGCLGWWLALFCFCC
jgi:hypothetical protein